MARIPADPPAGGLHAEPARAITRAGGSCGTCSASRTFTAHSLFRQAARMLHGLPRRGEGDKVPRTQPRTSTRDSSRTSPKQPAAVPGHGLQETVTQLTRLPRDDEAVRSAIDQWIDASATAGAVKSGSLERNRDLLRLVIEAAIWSRPDHHHVLRDGDACTRRCATGSSCPTRRPSGWASRRGTTGRWCPRPRWATSSRCAGPPAAAGARRCSCCGSTAWAAGCCTTPTTCWPARESTGPHVILTSATSWLPGLVVLPHPDHPHRRAPTEGGGP